jgi:kynurenine formamidase
MCTPALMQQVYASSGGTPPGWAATPCCAQHDGAAARGAELDRAEEEAADLQQGGLAATPVPVPAAPLLGEGATTRRNVLRGLLGAAAVPALAACAAPAAAVAAPGTVLQPGEALVPKRVFEMSHVLTRDFPVVRALVKEPEIRQIRFIDVDGFNANEIHINEHSGTHLDPPGHFRTGEPTAEQLPVERLIAPLVVIRIAGRAAMDNDTEVTVDDIREHESRFGRLPAGALVAMDSGWTQRVTMPNAFLNEGPDGLLHFPGFCTEAALFMINERDVVGIASDTPSLDVGSLPAPTTHQAWLPTGRYGIEALAIPPDLPDRGATVVVGGPRHEGSLGGPVRVLAFTV